MSENKRLPEFNKLKTYLEYSDRGIFVVECNSKRAQRDLISELKTVISDEIELIDYSKVEDYFVNDLRKHQNSGEKIVIYHSINNVTIDIIKTLNLSREILKDIGKVVLIMPSYLVWKIKYEEPNLRDYIIEFIEYNKKTNHLYEPIFAIDSHSNYTKAERNALKHISNINSKYNPAEMSSLFTYIERFNYKKMTDKEAVELSNYMFECISEVMLGGLGNSENKMASYCEDICRKIGWTFANQNRFEQAIEAFETIDNVIGNNKGKKMYDLHKYEGLAYCYYHSERYDKAKEQLLLMTNILNDFECEYSCWKARVYNDYACCYMQEKNYDKAIELLKTAKDILTENNEYSEIRQFRYEYNIMLIAIAQNKELYLFLPEWRKLGKNLLKNKNSFPIYYLKYVFFDLWVRCIECGETVPNSEEIKQYMNYARNTFSENDYELARFHYTCACIYKLEEKYDMYKYHITKAKNIALQSNTKQKQKPEIDELIRQLKSYEEKTNRIYNP